MEKEQVKAYQAAIKKGDFKYSYFDDIVVEGDGQGKLRMGIISDTHLYPFNPRQVDRTARAINLLAEEGMDLIFIDGDVTQTGAEIEYAEWNKVKEKLNLKNSILRISMGNHELAKRDTKDLFIQYYDQLPDAHYKVNGYHVIKVSPDGDIHTSEYGNVTPWLEKHLAMAKEDTGDLPIFVFFHHPVENTYYSTRSENGYWGNMNKSVFDDYPMVITFSGHNHAPSNHPRAVWQGNYTAVNVPSMYYAEGPKGIGTTTYYEEVSDVYQGIFVEAEGSKVTIKVYNFHNDSFADQVFSFDTAQPESFIYKEGRKDQSLEAVFSEDALISVETTDQTASIQFKQAQIPEEDTLMDIVDYYQFDIKDETGESVQQSTAWSHWIAQPQAETFTAIFKDLKAATDYTLTITPVNGFGKAGQSLNVEFETQEA